MTLYQIIVYLLCHGSLYYCNSFWILTGTMPWPGFPLAAINTKVLINMPDEDAHTVRLHQETLCKNIGYESCFGNLKLP